MFTTNCKNYLIAVMAALLNGQKIPEKPSDVTFEDLYQLAQFHCVESMVSYAIEQLELKPDQDLLERWRKNRDGNIMKLMSQLGELEQLSIQFESMKIPHLPLKGPILMDYYPQFDYRYMGDIDIIVKEEDFNRVDEFMKAQGYQPKDEDWAIYHQEYVKPYNGFEMRVEIHHDIMPSDSPYYPIMKDYWEWSTLVPNSQYRYQMPIEQFYLHILTHLAKHYYEEGTGIRSVMDIYVLNRALKDKLNQDFLKQQLELVGLTDFRKDVEELAQSWFTGQILPKRLEEMADYFMKQGAFGLYETRVNNLIAARTENSSKTKYVFSRIFHDRKRMEQRYPRLKKYPFLLPFYWIYRPIESLLDPKMRKMVRTELTKLKEKDK